MISMGWPKAARARSKNQRLRLACRRAFVPTTRTAVRAHGAQTLAESLQAAQGAFGGGVIQPAAIAQAGGEAHHFAQSIQK